MDVILKENKKIIVSGAVIELDAVETATLATIIGGLTARLAHDAIRHTMGNRKDGNFYGLSDPYNNLDAVDKFINDLYQALTAAKVD